MSNKLLIFALSSLIVGSVALYVFQQLYPYSGERTDIDLSKPHKIVSYYRNDGTQYYKIEVCFRWDTPSESWVEAIKTEFPTLDEALTWLEERSLRWWTLEVYKGREIYKKEELVYSDNHMYWLPRVAYYVQNVTPSFESISIARKFIDMLPSGGTG